MVAAVLWVPARPAASATADRDAGREAAEVAFGSISAEWSAAFTALGRRYDPPRLIFVEPPRNHPGRGDGYARGIALIDVGELGDIEGLFPRDANTLIALIVAHEVAHHVQFLNARDRHVPPVTDAAREQEADCAAGWWLGRANARAVATTGQVGYPISDLDHGFARLLHALELLNYRFSHDTASRARDPHGSGPARVEKILQGASTGRLPGCGVGVSP